MSYRVYSLENDDMPYFGVNRYLCDVLEDMRKCFETLNFAPMKSLIEEAQILGNRMEAGLGDKRDLVKLGEERHKLKQEYKRLQKLVEELKAEKEKLSPESNSE